MNGTAAHGARFAVLAVCTANVCRSPMMEALLREQLAPGHFEVASAGVRGWDKQPMDGMAALELARLGASAKGFLSHPLDSYLIDSADLILTATREHRSAVLEHDPRGLRRTFTLREFAALAERVEASSLPDLVATAARSRSLGPIDIDIADPYRRSPEVHRATADAIHDAVSRTSVVLNSLALAAQTH